MVTKIFDIFKLLRIKFSPLNDIDDNIRTKTTQLFRKRQILFRYLLQSQFSQITCIARNVLGIEWKDSVHSKLFLFLNVTLTLIYLNQRCFKIVSFGQVLLQSWRSMKIAKSKIEIKMKFNEYARCGNKWYLNYTIINYLFLLTQASLISGK